MNSFFNHTREVEEPKKVEKIVSLYNSQAYITNPKGSTSIPIKKEKVTTVSINRVFDLRERYSTIYQSFSEEMILSFNDRMTQVISRLSDRDITIQDIVLDTFTEDSFIVSFPKRRDVKLTINLMEPDRIIVDGESINNVEVAYLTYKNDGRRRIINNTLHNIIEELMDIL